VKDYTSGYRGFSGAVLNKMFARYGQDIIEEHNFAATVELLLKSTLVTTSCEEVPLVLHYEKKSGVSKMKILRTIGDYLRVICRLKRRRRVF
jgi:dolichol-phosphate mannosyltransferase